MVVVSSVVSGQNSIVIVAGSNLLLTPSDVEACSSKIAQSKVVVCQLEVTQETSLAALNLAQAR